MNKKEKVNVESASAHSKSTKKVRGGNSKAFSTSLILGLLDKLTDAVYNAVMNGLFGRIFTAYSSEQAAFERGFVKNYLADEINSNNKFHRIRSKLSKAFEGSIFIGKLGDMVRSMLSTSLKLYGNFLLCFGLYSILIYFLRALIPELGGYDLWELAVPVVSILLSLPLLMSRKSLGRAVGYSRILRLLFTEGFGFKDESFDIPVKRSNRKANFAIILGMIAGLSTFFIDPIIIPIFILAFLAISMVIITPEIGIICSIFFLPFLSISEYPSVILALLVFVTTIGYLIKLLRGKRIFKIELLDLFVIFFGVIIFMAGIISAGGADSLASAILSCVLMLGFFLVVNTMRTEKWINRCVSALVASSVIVAMIGIWEYVSGAATVAWIDKNYFPDIEGRVVSVFENPNVLATYLTLCLPLVIAKMQRAETGRGRLLGFVSTLVMIGCLILTWSRGAWLAVIISLLIMALINNRGAFKALFVLGLCVPALPFVLPDNIVSRFMSIGDLSDSSSYYRVYTWRGTIEAIKDYFLGGIGYGNLAYSEIYPKYAYAGIEAAEHSHNLFLQMFLGLGIFGLLIFLMVIFLFFQKNLEFLRCTDDKNLKIFVSAAFAGICGALIMGMFDYIWYNYRVFFVFWIVFAISCAYIRFGNREAERQRVTNDSNADAAAIDI